jgi:hypothetical protein
MHDLGGTSKVMAKVEEMGIDGFIDFVSETFGLVKLEETCT